MHTRNLTLSVLATALLAACGPSAQELAGTIAAETLSAQQTGTAEIQDAVNAILTATAEAATDTPVPTDTPDVTNTFTPEPATQTPTITLSPTKITTVQGQQCEGGGCHNIKFNNKTGQVAYVTLSGPGSYYFVVPPGDNQRFWILPGLYNITVNFCGGESFTITNPLNSGWYFNLKCP